MVVVIAIEFDVMCLLIWCVCACVEVGLLFRREAYLARLFCAEKVMKIGFGRIIIFRRIKEWRICWLRLRAG